MSTELMKALQKVNKLHKVMEEKSEAPEVSKALERKYKPVVTFGVNIDTRESGVGGNKDWRKEERNRLEAEVAALKMELSKFDAKEAAEQVRKALEIRLKLKTLRLEECKIKTSSYGGMSDVY